MAARPSWKGHLKLSLVSCPVALFNAATATQKVAFHLLNRETGHRLRRQMVDGETGEVVEADGQVHAYEVSKGEYVTVEEEEIDRLRIESSHTIDVERFVPRAEVEDLYLDAPYYLAPDGPMGEVAFAVIREAMRRGKVVGIARLVLARREHMVMVEPLGPGLLLTTLRFPYEVKPAAEAFDEIESHPVADEMLDLADHIIATKRGAFEPGAFEDRYETALRGLIEAKKQGRPAPAPAEGERPDNVIDLMEALRRSVGATPGGGKRGRAPAKAPKRSAGTSKAKAPPTAKRTGPGPAGNEAAPARKAPRRNAG